MSSTIRRRSSTRIPTQSYVLVLIAVIASLAPFVFLVAKSLAPTARGGVGSLWGELLERMPVGLYMLNSAIVALSATAIVVVFSCMAGYGFAKLWYPGRAISYALVIGALSVPLATTILPNYVNFARAGGVGTFWAPIVLYAVASLPFATILMTSYFRSLPDELTESGLLDGASYRRIFVSIMLPIVVPAMVTVGVLSFLAAWNDLLTGLLFLPDTDMRTISVGVAALQGVRNSNFDLVLTGSLLSAIPPVAVFIIFQRYLVSGITAGIAK